ncbi:hypothetical protein GLAREA_11539 [Glarea lozoyensis ATCC 20868]|uniref:2EXR domain-containing protein n=1 Tax=Glarea lozoyensis (strain ATCC 20868 / MF5171) TaxID=1116229 RepID=S3DE74_GLAL2|nr:uncharacterized protein GLAREA_11539 [Glarea lozoyensis ATCC 20868]EPE24958.1 hypothetical protein GLAREA_11539 [Glarea lozoyensis ATCC 20868]
MFKILPAALESSKHYCFPHFTQFPTEIRDHVWDICAQNYPARIVDLREIRQTVPTQSNSANSRQYSGQSSTAGTLVPTAIIETKVVAGFKSRTPAPTLLYVCQASRNMAKRSYTKAFGTEDMPPETWINFEKDVLYITKDFCYLGLRDLPFAINPWQVTIRFNTGQEEPFGYFYKELKHDIRKVKDLAISGHWNFGSDRPWDYETDGDMGMITTHFARAERVTLVEPQHALGRTSHLRFAEISPYEKAQSENPGHLKEMLGYRNHLFDRMAWDRSGNCNDAGMKTRSSESRLATEEDRCRAVPDAADRRDHDEYAEKMSVFEKDEELVKERLRKYIGIIPGQVIL